MTQRIRPAIFCFLLLGIFCSRSFAQTKTIRFEVAYPKTQTAAAHDWMKKITSAGSDRIRLVTDSDLKVRVEQIGNESEQKNTTIVVYARIDDKLRLNVEGKSFRRSDVAELQRWIENLRSKKSLDPSKQPGAFGLTPEELVSIYEVLAKPFPDSMRGQKVLPVVKKIREEIGINIGADDLIVERLSDDVTIPDELKGVSCGTVLAAVIRPLGLVVVIKEKRLRIVDSRNAKEHWPIGWPPQQRPGLTAPALFREAVVDIRGISIKEVLQSVEKETLVPFIIDQNTLARHGVELDSVKVEIADRKTFFFNVVRLSLLQSKPRLVAELRVDEASKPFLWVTKLGKK